MENLMPGIMKKLIVIFILFAAVTAGAQDTGTTGSKVAGILTGMPAGNITELERLMEEMTELGYEGRKQITDLVVPPSGDDDTKARFAIESYSRYLSSYGHRKEALIWESEIIEAVHSAEDPLVRSFFLSQLKYIGTKSSVEFASGFITDEDMCEAAIAVIASSDSPDKEDILAMSLQIEGLPCVVSVINALADMKSDEAVADYIVWYARGYEGIRTAALNAMAESGHELALAALESAASASGYQWEPTGATAAYIKYARNIGDKGEVKDMEKICRNVINNGSTQYRLAALEVLVHYKGYEAIEYLKEAFKKGETEYRKGALALASDIPGTAATRKWINIMTEVDVARKAEIIEMLGNRGDMTALGTIEDALFCPSKLVRSTAAVALAKINGRESVPELIDYIRSYETAIDQEAGYNALLTVTDSRRRDLIEDALEGSGDYTKSTMLLLLSAGGENRFFKTVYRYTSSPDQGLRSVAFSQLKKLATPHDQEELVNLLYSADNGSEIMQVQLALVAAVNRIGDNDEKTSYLIKALEQSPYKERIIPVLAAVGGKNAVMAVKKEFDEGNAETRIIAFEALKEWIDHETLPALLDICASGNKNYSGKAFSEYLNMVSETELAGEKKLELLEKIRPYAKSEEQANELNSLMEGIRDKETEIRNNNSTTKQLNNSTV